MEKVPSDFKGDAVGVSEKKTVSILELAQGSVLLIDEAYALNDESFGKEVLNTINDKVQGKPGDNIAVILIGYKPQMLQMLRQQNAGLTRRFNLESALEFEDFSDTELLAIISDQCRPVANSVQIWHHKCIVRILF